ncbi:type VI secretion system membrane subunit TssM [Sediminicoccus sp. KRV36]|uniref:type VI secretion system membrane subunit TssM n=1 Tax=Sediminicoccus sp. KRV36 TaxID=3133721 RepID=UPI00200D583A|nr:type VI secretion system membrane subunit TssM [Sediminicoccus rosea]UPY37736.1 type VI secretion system membrane subunit TssM [Sediminicoccus rosea]
MRAFLSIPALAALAGVLLLDVVIWIFAPLLGEAFEALWLRGLLGLVLVLIWAGVTFMIGRGRDKRDAGLLEAAAAPDPKAKKDEAAAEEEAELRAKLTDALGKLKNATGGKGGYLYDLPWYAIIGPPGSGKTTALLNSGLEFPLAEGRVGGVGGTRFCDWWLTERAVLIDTAGRYTTQDSDADADKAGWERFLDLLKKNRPRQPLNGVLVAFGMDMLARLDATQRESHARSVRRRIRELETRLGQRLPVYFMVTKSDLLPGFIEFFDDLDKDQRQQVWGFTFPPQTPPEGAVTQFPAEFAALSERLMARQIERLQNERGPSQRAMIAGFPTQFASLEAPLQAFLQSAFGGSKLDPAPFLRGVYFTSGTQEGTPLDRLAGALSRSFGLDPARPAAAMGQKGRAYFIGRQLRDVVFNEARLAANDRGLESRRRMIQIGSWAAALLLVLGGGIWGWMSSGTEAAREARLAAAVTAAEQAGAGAPLARVQSPDLAGVLAYLETNRALPPAAAGSGPGFGLSQEEMLTSGAEGAYRRALDRVLLPRLLSRLETQIREGIQRPDFLYEAVRVYLMLGKQGPLDRALVREWFALDWQQAFPGAVNQPGREALARHLDAMMTGTLATYPLDGALVDQARRVFSRLPMAQRVYARLRPLAENVPAWTPGQPLGAAGQRYFARASGRPMTEGVPGLFTVEGLHRAVLPRLSQAALEAASESWVLGPEAATAGAADPRRMEADVLALYAADYVRAWEAMIADLVLPAFPSLNAAAEGLNLLGAPNSPMKDLLRSIARQVSPGTAPEAPGGAAAGAAAGAVAQAAQAAAGATASRVAAAVGTALGGSGAAPVAQVVETRFAPLREAAGAPIDGVLAILNDLYVQVARLANSPPGTVLPPSPGLDPGQRLLSEAQRQPDPLRGWLTAISQSTGRARSGGAQAAIAAAAGGGGGGGGGALVNLCRGIETRFPFRRQVNAPDMPVDDFIRLFAPGGVFDSFFTQNLRAYTDTTQRPWRPVATDGLPPPVSAADLAQFQRAQAIREAFFPAGVANGFRFQLLPAGLSAGTTGATLEASGARVALPVGGGGRPIDLQFPALHPITLTFDPASSMGDLAYDGAWSTLKLVFLHRLTATPQPDRFRLMVERGDRRAEFVLQAASSVNPFALRDMLEFRCPTFAPPAN